MVSNFRIDSDIRLQRMKDSFSSFKEANITSWIVNIRGSQSYLAKEFLEKNITQRASITGIESDKGWFHDTSSLMQDIDEGYLLYWIEDHINTASIETLNSVFKEISRSGIDQIQYSFFSRAKYDSCQKVFSSENEHFRVVNFTNKSWGTYLSSCNERGIVNPYLISLASIMSVQHFKSILSKRDPILRRHSKHTPFDFEKSHVDTHWLPLETGILGRELFACIDTDHDGPSLISRGLYRDSKEPPVNMSINFVAESKGIVSRKFIYQFLSVVLPKRLLVLLKRISFYFH